MKKIIGLALLLVLALNAVSEAGIFRKRNGEKRAPVRNTLRVLGGHCHGDSCHR